MFSVAACNSQTSETKTEGGRTIGLNYFGSGSYVLGVLRNNSEVVIKANGDTPLAMDNQFNLEKIITDLESMIQAGVKGVVVWTPVQSQMLTIAQMCKEAKVPFVLNDKVPSDPEIIAQIMENPYFAGAIGPDSAGYGEAAARFCIEQGYKTALISGPNVGDPTDQPRIDQFTKVFEEAGGKVLAVTYGEEADRMQRTEDLLVTYGEVDVIYGSGGDMGVTAVKALANYPDWKTKVVTAGLDEVVIDLLADPESPLVMTCGDFWVCGQFSAMILENYLNGTPLKDAEGKPIFIDDVAFFTVSADQIQAFKDTFLKQNCYSDEEIKKLSKTTYDEFVKAVRNFSFEERAKARGVTIPNS